MYYCVSLRCMVCCFDIFIYFNCLTIFIYKMSLFCYKFPKNLRCMGFQLLKPLSTIGKQWNPSYRTSAKSQLHSPQHDLISLNINILNVCACMHTRAWVCLMWSLNSVLAWQKPQNDNSKRKTGSPGAYFSWWLFLNLPSFLSFCALRKSLFSHLKVKKTVSRATDCEGHPAFWNTLALSESSTVASYSFFLN